MPGTSKKAESPLTTAAAALEAELGRYESAALEAARLKITSEKSIARAKSQLEACAAAEEKLAAQLQAFATAMQAVQAKQQACMEAGVLAARRLEERARDRAALVERFGALGLRAKDIEAPVQAVMERHASGATETELLAALGQVLERTDGLVADAASFESEAREHAWEDLARAAADLKQQLQAARNKVERSRRDLANRAPS
jgi:hypothetical protein